MDAAPPDPAPVPGRLFSTRRDRPVPGRNWCFWYLQHSKKVWFQLEPAGSATGLVLEFRYRGRPILHRSEVPRRPSGAGVWHPRPVVWGDRLGIGFAQGPEGTNLYLHLWTRWTWIHPEACGRPQLFTVRRAHGAAGSAAGDRSSSSLTSGVTRS